MVERNLINWYTITITVLVMTNHYDGTRVMLAGGVVETVERRSYGDIYMSTDATVLTCHEDDELTYLVDEDKCVTNGELMRGMIFIDTYKL